MKTASYEDRYTFFRKYSVSDTFHSMRYLRENRAPDQIRQIDQGKNLLGRDNAVFTPHIGSYSEESLGRILDTILENITRFALGRRGNQIIPPLKK
ncbi:MAG: hypothetical protein WAV46_01440 [Candidatus Moraniibacteriota bacterium]